MFCKYTDFPQIIQGIGRKVDGGGRHKSTSGSFRLGDSGDRAVAFRQIEEITPRPIGISHWIAAAEIAASPIPSATFATIAVGTVTHPASLDRPGAAEQELLATHSHSIKDVGALGSHNTQSVMVGRRNMNGIDVDSVIETDR